MLIARRRHLSGRSVEIAGAKQVVLQIAADARQIDTAGNADFAQILSRSDAGMQQQRGRADGTRRKNNRLLGGYFQALPVLVNFDTPAAIAARKQKAPRPTMYEDSEILPPDSRRQIGVGDALPAAADNGQRVEGRPGEACTVMLFRSLEAAFFAGGHKTLG